MYACVCVHVCVHVCARTRMYVHIASVHIQVHTHKERKKNAHEVTDLLTHYTPMNNPHYYFPYNTILIMLHIYNSLYRIVENVSGRKHWQIDLFTLLGG